MTFRLQMFVLVMVVAVTAIGATAWLSFSIASRQYQQQNSDSLAHQEQIVTAVQQYGLLHGSWPGVDSVVVQQAERTKLHVQLRTEDQMVLVDSDVVAGRTAGQVQGAALGIDPRPALEQDVVSVAQSAPEVSGYAFKTSFSRFPMSDLFSSARGDDPGIPAPALMVRQAAQYRGALNAVRCIAEQTGQEAALRTERWPYLTAEQTGAYPECVAEADRTVRADTDWLEGIGKAYSDCLVSPEEADERNITCLLTTFTRAVTTSSAVPLQLYLGTPDENTVSYLGRPAALGAAGLLLFAFLGTMLIARRVSKPVNRLTEASQRLAGGQLDVRVPAEGRSELARLSASFNAMAEAVQRSEERQRRLVADVAHELRTPLSNLRGYLEGLSDGVVEPSRELFASLHEETMLQRRILDDLQVLALAEAGDLKYTKAPMDLAEVVSGSVTAQRAVAAEAGVALTLDAPAPVAVTADPDRIRQVIGNLLSNAIRYTDRGGHVLVRVRAEDGEAVLTVRDTGVGISPADLTRVFDRFWRADPARQRATGGTGLGLTISHRIVADHGGRIHVASELGEGTTFTVRL